MKRYSSKEVIKQYNKFYNMNVKSFSYNGESELEEIILEIFELDEDKYFVEITEKNIVEIYEKY